MGGVGLASRSTNVVNVSTVTMGGRFSRAERDSAFETKDERNPELAGRTSPDEASRSPC